MMIHALDETANSDSGNSAIICPATSSTTTFPGSFNRRIRSVRDPAQMPAQVTKPIATNCSGHDLSNKKRPIPTTDPNVPGISGK